MSENFAEFPRPELNAPAPPERKISTGEHMALSSFWAASNFVWGALLLIVIASQIKDMIPDKRAFYMGLTISVGAIAALVIPLFVGPLSDRCTKALGRRRPFIFTGVVINMIGLVMLFFAGRAHMLGAYVACYFLMTVGNNIATAAYSGVIPDLVPTDQRGVASGFMAVMSQVGTLLGIIICGYLAANHSYAACYGVLLAVLALGLAVTMRYVKETPITTAEPMPEVNEFFKSLLEPLRSRDFMWVWITRALVMLGFYSFQPLIQYYLNDVIGLVHAEQKASYVGAVVIFFAAFSGYIGGLLSDRFGRKKIVYFANTFMAVMCIAFIFCTSLGQVMFVGALFGIGYGAYVSVDWALGTDVLPSKDDAAKDMAVWHISMTLPQAIAAAPAGILIGAFGMRESIVDGEVVKHYTHMGYAVLLLVAACFLGLGAILLRNVKGSR